MPYVIAIATILASASIAIQALFVIAAMPI
jgi:hypothetical protein